MTEEQEEAVRQWTRAIIDIVEAGRTPRAVIAVADDDETVQAVTDCGIEDVPEFLRDAAAAVEGAVVEYSDYATQ